MSEVDWIFAVQTRLNVIIDYVFIAWIVVVIFWAALEDE